MKTVLERTQAGASAASSPARRECTRGGEQVTVRLTVVYGPLSPSFSLTNNRPAAVFHDQQSCFRCTLRDLGESIMVNVKAADFCHLRLSVPHLHLIVLLFTRSCVQQSWMASAKKFRETFVQSFCSWVEVWNNLPAPGVPEACYGPGWLASECLSWTTEIFFLECCALAVLARFRCEAQQVRAHSVVCES